MAPKKLGVLGKQRMMTGPKPRTKPEALDLAPTAPESGILGPPMMFYVLLGSIGLSLGASLFLFREVRRLGDANEAALRKQKEATTKELTELTETLKVLTEYVTRQSLAQGREPPTLPRPTEELPKAPGAKAPKVSDGGPRESKKATKTPVLEPVAEDVVVEDVVEESDSSCDEDGVCAVRK